ncbi:MAG: hypothetical protein K8Q99_03990 [Acholeplasmataceae bacterium]|nr:hypothetical protein [Acholeplasmataceae bacterium]
MIPIEITYTFAFLFYFSSLAIHILILNKKISYQLVNGGRSKDFIEQQKQSKASIFILIVLMMYVLYTAVSPTFRLSLVYLVLSFVLVLFWLLGTIMQIIGTKFEKRVVFWINLVGLLSHILLMLSYFK